MAKYYSYEAGTQAIVIDLNSIIAIRRDGNSYYIHTTGGPITVTEAAAGKILPVWKSSVIGQSLTKG
ncbi:MAG: hypothetical protein QOE14_2584 [Humisphaera sp.]|nr:hypothetical protein [Humisphaera sp.]